MLLERAQRRQPSGSMPPNPVPQKRLSLNTIETSVTRLLFSTKHLLEGLVQWSHLLVDTNFVSDAYVKLGNDFRAATKAINAAGVDTSELGDVPRALRVILEKALSEAPCKENLDKHLPSIQNIIYNLLQNLKPMKYEALQLEEKRRALRRLANSHQSTRESTAHPSTEGSSRSRPDIRPPDPALAAQQDALAQLQKGNLPRRASKRFSAYQYAKLSQGSSSVHHQLPEETILELEPAVPVERTPMTKNIPVPTVISPTPSRSPHRKSNPRNSGSTIGASLLPRNSTDSTESASRLPAHDTKRSPQTPELISIFLEINSRTKRATVPLPVTIASLRLLFMEKFAYSPGTDTFPEIYIQHESTGTFYELEEAYLDKVREGSALRLNEAEAESLLIKALETKLANLDARFDQLADTLTESIVSAVKAIEPVAPPPPPTPITSPTTETSAKSAGKPLIAKEISALQREVQGLRQLQKENQESYALSVKNIIDQVKQFQDTGLNVSSSTNRQYMESSHSTLSDTLDTLLTTVDELQDVIESLRQDVVQRGVRVSEKQLKVTLVDINKAKTSLEEIKGYILREKPTWKKIWESELDKVCEEQQFANLQSDLARDLEDDISKIEETFDLIKQCSLEQVKHSAYRRNKIVAQLPIPQPGESVHHLKDAVLNEVMSIRPDHESRVEAIARAEVLRQRERELNSISEFQEELGEFVGVGKLKSSGGISEVERLRELRDEENRKAALGIV